MRIGNDYRYSYNKYLKPAKKTVFRSAGKIETIGRSHIGNKPDGFIGLVKVFDKDGKDVFLNAFKEVDFYGEIYTLKDVLNRTIGKLDLKICKEYGYEKFSYDEDPSHIFVNELKNYSNPNTPYYFRGLNNYKGVGTRLLQLALKRSYEEDCNGNIELNSKKDAINFYKLLGFVKTANYSMYLNPNRFKLPENSKFELMDRLGGL